MSQFLASHSKRAMPSPNGASVRTKPIKMPFCRSLIAKTIKLPSLFLSLKRCKVHGCICPKDCFKKMEFYKFCKGTQEGAMELLKLSPNHDLENLFLKYLGKRTSG
jgi:hypothetical protein